MDKREDTKTWCWGRFEEQIPMVVKPLFEASKLQGSIKNITRSLKISLSLCLLLKHTLLLLYIAKGD